MKARERFTLTNRLLALSALIVVATTLLVVATSAAGVYKMASRQEFARLAAYGDVLASRIGGSIARVQAAVDAAAADPTLAGDDEAAIMSSLAALVSAHSSYAEGAALLVEDGTAVAVWPDNTLDSHSLTALKAAQIDPELRSLIWVPADSDGRGGLWALGGFAGGDASTRLLAVRLRTSVIESELEEIRELPGQPRAIVFDAEGTPVFGNMPLDSIARDRIELSPESSVADRGSIKIEGPDPLVGGYTVIPHPEGAGWSVAVLEPASGAWKATWAALRPGLVGWLAALGIALVGGLLLVRHVTRPLRSLEKRVRAIGAGDPVQPEPIAGDDEVARLLDAFNDVITRFDRLTDAVALLARMDDRDHVLKGVVETLASMFEQSDVEVWLVSEEGGFELAMAHGSLESRRGARIAPGLSPWLGRCAGEAQPLSGLPEPDDALMGLRSGQVSDAMAAPLSAGTECIGVVAVMRREGKAFSERELETLRSFVAQAAVALQNARLFDKERRSRRDAEALREIAERAASPTGTKQTLLFAAATEAELLGFEGSGFVLLEDPRSYGMEKGFAGTTELWVSAWKAIASEGASGEPVYVSEGSSGQAAAAALEASGAHAALLTPLVRQGVCVGALVCTTTDLSRAPGPKRSQLARTIGAETSLALENAFLFQAAKRRADNLETIFKISHAVGSSLQTRVVLNRVLDVVQKILSADAVMLMTYDAQRKVISVPMARGILHRDMLDATFFPGDDVPGRVFETGKPERHDHISRAKTPLLEAAAAQGLESLLAVPLLARGRSIGVLMVFSQDQAAFSSEEMDLLRTFAAQAALAIDTAELFSREHHVASVLQSSILPSELPHVPGLDTASVYLPAGADAEIGGDYYDLFVGPDGKITVSIGDVCGKGVVAATKTSMIKYALRGMVAAGLGPGRVLEELNRMLLDSFDPTSIVTLWVGELDIAAGTLRYANGGHPPGLLLGTHGGRSRIERLETTGALLGAVADGDWQERETRLSPGSTLLLYTDGVTEARNGALFFGEGRVRRALRAGGTASTVAHRLLALVQRFSAGDMRDDAAILVVRYEADSLGAVSDG